ncbi:MAG: sigma factor, partial [Pseudomonadota bacterium]
MRDDAQQAAAIGVHRALASFDPDKARFTTHVTWQIRGELQSLRHRMRLDQRNSARNAGITTCSLDDLNAQPNENAPFEIVDESAVCRTESGASDGMALALMDRLLTTLDAPETEREIV